MEQLIEDYKRRLNTVNEMLNENFNSDSIESIRKHERLKTKASLFKTFITELEHELKN
jgi:hypothetical protein